MTRIRSQGRKTVSLCFKVFFDNPLSPAQVWQVLPPDLNRSWVYGLDGKWLERKGVFIIHRNFTTKENLYWSFHPSESYVALHHDLEALTELLDKQQTPVGAISDWKGAIVSAVSSHFDKLPHQRCLTHVVHQAERLLPRRSPFEATLSLRSVAKKLPCVSTVVEKRAWLASLIYWEKKYKGMLKEKTIGNGTKKKWWYTHGNLRSGWRLLTHNWDPFFIHLDHSMIPKSNNSLEGVVSQLSSKLSDHRGMKTKQQVSFLCWYFTFTRTKTKEDLRKLWDYWKAVV